jgi:hypothetical protein
VAGSAIAKFDFRTIIGKFSLPKAVEHTVAFRKFKMKEGSKNASVKGYLKGPYWLEVKDSPFIV